MLVSGVALSVEDGGFGGGRVASGCCPVDPELPRGLARRANSFGVIFLRNPYCLTSLVNSNAGTGWPSFPAVDTVSG